MAVIFATNDKRAASSESATSLASEQIERHLRKRTDPGFIVACRPFLGKPSL
jgi:hypothetical protein